MRDTLRSVEFAPRPTMESILNTEPDFLAQHKLACQTQNAPGSSVFEQWYLRLVDSVYSIMTRLTSPNEQRES